MVTTCQAILCCNFNYIRLCEISYYASIGVDLTSCLFTFYGPCIMKYMYPLHLLSCCKLIVYDFKGAFSICCALSVFHLPNRIRSHLHWQILCHMHCTLLPPFPLNTVSRGGPSLLNQRDAREVEALSIHCLL